MESKKVIISIDNEFHELVEDKQAFHCIDCSLLKYCANERSVLCGFFSNKLSHFVKLEDGIVEDYE